MVGRLRSFSAVGSAEAMAGSVFWASSAGADDEPKADAPNAGITKASAELALLEGTPNAGSIKSNSLARTSSSTALVCRLAAGSVPTRGPKQQKGKLGNLNAGNL
jgi:hypothetical protein